LEALVLPETAGDPMSEQKWVRSSLRHLSEQLGQVGHLISPPTLARLLRKLGYSLRVNVKKLEASAAHPERQQQFAYLETQKQAFRTAGLPLISVDTKKKELIGNFKNAGQTWCQHAEEVNVHDFPSDALARAVPYGIYDVSQKRGSVYVGISADTPEFAVTAIARWWEEEGQLNYPQAKQLLILADAGGSNGYRSRSFKLYLQERVSDRYGLTVSVCHYPTGCSKWNPIEHRLFSYISLNWAAKPLRTLETMLNFLRGTTTSTGLTVRATLLEGTFEKGQSVSDDQMKQLNIEHAEVCANWNYTLRPRVAELSSP
jgi:Rhodopirellula transposase DDE domain